MHVCLAYVRPYGQNLPQPKPGTGTQNVDVMLHGTIGPDGKIHDAMINRSGRDDLNNEALKIFSTWTFTPAVCNGKPFEVPADVTLHFQNR
jgi:TonB family protein